MSTIVTGQAPAKMQEITLQGKGKLILTQGLIDQIDYLHKYVGPTEWCGILFYKKISGEINSSSDFVLQAEQIYPMNIGSETYTAAELEGIDTIDMYEKCNPNYELKQGLIHTHHRMATFFSGTDMSELHDNAPLHNYYLSLIVNFAGSYTAKIAYVADVVSKTKNVFTYQDSQEQVHSQESETENKRKVLVMMDLEIIKPELQEVVPTYFQERHTHLQQKRTVNRPYASNYGTGYGSYGSQTKSYGETGYSGQGSLFSKEEGKIERTVHPGSAAAQKAKDIQKVQKGSGKLVNAEGKYISIEPQEMKELVVEWLNTGLDVDSDMIPSTGKFNTINDGLLFFEAFYEKNPVGLDIFLRYMQKYAKAVFKEYSPKLIKNRGTSILSSWIDNISIASDLYNILEVIDQDDVLEDEWSEITK